MRICVAVLFIGASLALILMPDGIVANAINSAEACPPVVHKTCGSRCQNTCEHPDAESHPCDQTTCMEGYFCKPGYVREFPSDEYFGARCIRPSECPKKISLE